MTEFCLSTSSNLALCTVFCAALGFTAPALSQAGPEIEELVVTGSRLTRPEAQSNVFTLSADELRAQAPVSVLDALQYVPGVYVSQPGGRGGVAALSLRGAESNFSVVLVDGVQVNDPTNTRGGSFDFSTIDINAVHRIELLKGAAAAIYGSDALAGVVNIITYDPDEQETTVGLTVGEDGLRQAGLRTALQGDATGSLHLAASFTEDDNPAGGSSFQSKGLRANYDKHFQQHVLNAQLVLSRSEQMAFPEDSGGRRFAVLPGRDARAVDSDSLAMRYEYNATDEWRLQGALSHYSREEDYRSPGIAGGARDPFGIPPNQARSQFRRSQLRVHAERREDRFDLLVGAQWQRERGESDGEVTFLGPVSFDIARDTLSAFAELYGEPLANAAINVGVRFDKAESEAGEVTFKFGGSYVFARDYSVFADIGTAYKLPSFFALANPLVGNPTLRPETVRTTQVGVRGPGLAGSRFELAGFRSDYRNLIDFDSELFTNVNRSDVTMSGWDLSANGELWGERLRYRLFFSYVDIDLAPSGKLRQRPQWRWGGAANLALSASWSAHLHWQYNDQRFDSSIPNPKVVLAAYQRVDLALHWLPRPDWKVTFALENALDETYADADGFLANGRRARIGLRLSF
ncbi:MAG: TonB-dependent receptor plug domain-containing protein [Pseudomonadales bacterium]